MYSNNSNSPRVGSLSCLQTTVTELSSQQSRHTVPHWLSIHTSTRPSDELAPPTSLTSPVVHTVGTEKSEEEEEAEEEEEEEKEEEEEEE